VASLSPNRDNRGPPLPCYSRQCSECGKPFQTSQPTASFCSRKCKADSANLEAVRGKKLYRLAYGWRKGNGARFSDLSALMDVFIREDREAGRPPPPFGRRDGENSLLAHYTSTDSRKRRQRNQGDTEI
jgi:hypothetical protein